MPTATATIAAPPLASLIPSWRRSLTAGNKSKRTIEAYTADAELLATYLVDHRLNTAVTSVGRESVEMFLSDQVKRHKPSTAATRYRSLRLFFAWLLEEGEIKTSPMAHMKPPIIPEQPIPVVSESDLVKLLKACESNDYAARRDLAALLLLLDAGLRASELTNITVADVDLDHGLVRVLGKNRRVRSAPFGPRTAKALDRLLRARAGHRDHDRPELFLGVRGPITRSGLAQILEQRCREAGIPRVNPHRMRHSSAHMQLMAGASEGDMMVNFGWRSRSMVSRYGASMAAERARDSHHRIGVVDRLGVKVKK